MNPAAFFPQRQVTSLYALLIGVLLIAGAYFVGKKYGRKIKTQGDVVDTSTREIKPAELSHTPTEYNTMADKLFRAMSGAGTDEKQIYQVFDQVKSRSDIMALIKAFGTRETGAWYSRFKGSLPEWLTDEMSSSELAKLNSIIQSKGIDFKF